MRMYTETTRKRSRLPRNVLAVAAVALTVVGLVLLFSSSEEETKNPLPGNPAPAANPTSANGDEPAPGPEGMTRALAAQIGPSPLTVERAGADRARQCLTGGLRLFSKKDKVSAEIIKARSLLNTSYISGRLSAEKADKARNALEDLAKITVLREAPYVHPDDPYMLSYTFKSGDLLNSIRYASGDRRGHVKKKGVIAANGLNVPAAIIVRVNGLSSSKKFQAGSNYKLIRGPFHLVVFVAERKADLYLQDLFVKRFAVCVGRADTPTPTGFFRIAEGGKTTMSVYNPPVDSNLPNRTIGPGEAGYPLDKKGHNMKLEGIASLGTDIPVTRAYAIHGTNEPESIGRADSRGCIRLGEGDIAFVYDCLQSYGDPEDPRVSWTRWSTVWIRQ